MQRFTADLAPGSQVVITIDQAHSTNASVTANVSWSGQFQTERLGTCGTARVFKGKLAEELDLLEEVSDTIADLFAVFLRVLTMSAATQDDQPASGSGSRVSRAIPNLQSQTARTAQPVQPTAQTVRSTARPHPVQSAAQVANNRYLGQYQPLDLATQPRPPRCAECCNVNFAGAFFLHAHKACICRYGGVIDHVWDPPAQTWKCASLETVRLLTHDFQLESDVKCDKAYTTVDLGHVQGGSVTESLKYFQNETSRSMYDGRQHGGFKLDMLLRFGGEMDVCGLYWFRADRSNAYNISTKERIGFLVAPLARVTLKQA